MTTDIAVTFVIPATSAVMLVLLHLLLAVDGISLRLG